MKAISTRRELTSHTADVPEEYGGLRADFHYSVISMEKLARTNHTGLAAPNAIMKTIVAKMMGLQIRSIAAAG